MSKEEKKHIGKPTGHKGGPEDAPPLFSRGPFRFSILYFAVAMLGIMVLRIKATIVMPEGSPEVKRRATEETYGATVVPCRNTQTDREAVTAGLIDAHGYSLVHPYDNDRVIAGAGTAALELLNEVTGLDTVIAPVGGGGLLSGTCLSAHGINPAIQVVAAEPEGADDAARSLASGHLVPNERVDTVADGLRTNLCHRTFAIISRHVEHIVTVSDGEILAAMRFLWERMKLVVEPSGAVPLAALLSGKAETGAEVGLIVSGGNVDLSGFFATL